jgi:outer membrane receptor protein involved in Fe transport
MEGMLGLRWGNWVLDASGTLQRTEDVSEGYTGGHPLVGVPERLGYVGLSWSRGRMGVRWDVSYVGANSTDRLDTGDLRLPARVIHDLGVWWNVAAGIRIGLDVDNVLDRETRDVARFPLPGRLIFLSLGWRMGP